MMMSGTADPARLARARRHLYAAEGSDWFWWFGDYNPAESVSDFERLFRAQLGVLYTLRRTGDGRGSARAPPRRTA